MVCQKCQSTEATVHTTTIVNGSSTESHLCAKCSGLGMPAGIQGLVQNMGAHPGLSAMPADIQELIKNMLAPFPGFAPFNVPNAPNAPGRTPDGGILNRTCPHCGITLRDIQRTGRLGCLHDYSVFGDTLSQVIAVAQAGKSQHIGKVPSGAPAEVRRAVLQAKVDDTQRRLEGAVFREDYEQAAACRDEIKATREELSEGDGAQPSSDGA